MTAASFEDFYQVPDLEFDIVRLRNDLNKILDSKKFNTPGVTHFGAIPLNQIPNDKSSIEGNVTLQIFLEHNFHKIFRKIVILGKPEILRINLVFKLKSLNF